MSLRCESVAELVATGEPLGDLAEHAASCARCQRVVAMPARLATARREVDPGLGFSARMIVGAQHRITVRKRRRLAASLAAVTCASAFGVFVVTRTPHHEQLFNSTPVQIGTAPHAADEPLEPLGDRDLETLVDFADTPRALNVHAPWRQIEAPLRPYMKLVKGETP
jgi:hypothetical protein